jgi:hypothetical protein
MRNGDELLRCSDRPTGLIFPTSMEVAVVIVRVRVNVAAKEVRVRQDGARRGGTA